MLQLHARAIEIPLYKNREPVRVEAPVPPHMRKRASDLLGKDLIEPPPDISHETS
jgi:tRNA pseudouridine32 synthase/23S rRNA pseudouridine746 synthase